MLDLPEEAMKEVEKYAVRDSIGNQIGLTDDASKLAKETWKILENISTLKKFHSLNY